MPTNTTAAAGQQNVQNAEKKGKKGKQRRSAQFPFFLIFAFLLDFYFRYSSSALSGPTGPSRTCKRFRTACGLAVHGRHHSSRQTSSCRRDKNSLSSPCVPPPVSAVAVAAAAATGTALPASTHNPTKQCFSHGLSGCTESIRRLP